MEIDLGRVLVHPYSDHPEEPRPLDVREALVAGIAYQLQQDLKPQIDAMAKEVIAAEVDRYAKAAIAGAVGDALAKLLDGEFDIVDTWGERRGSTTLRAEIEKHLKSEIATFKRGDGGIGRDANKMKKMVDAAVDLAVREELDGYLKELRAETRARFRAGLEKSVEKEIGRR